MGHFSEMLSRSCKGLAVSLLASPEITWKQDIPTADGKEFKRFPRGSWVEVFSPRTRSLCLPDQLCNNPSEMLWIMWLCTDIVSWRAFVYVEVAETPFLSSTLCCAPARPCLLDFQEKELQNTLGLVETLEFLAQGTHGPFVFFKSFLLAVCGILHGE